MGGAIRHRRGPANAGPLYFVYFCSIRSGYAQIERPIIFAYCSIGLGVALLRGQVRCVSCRTGLAPHPIQSAAPAVHYAQTTPETCGKHAILCKKTIKTHGFRANRTHFQSKNGRFQPATTSGRTGAVPVSSSPCCLHKIRPHGRKTAPQAPTKGITGTNG